MFNRAIFRLTIVLLVSIAIYSASAQEGDITETAVSDDAKNGTSPANVSDSDNQTAMAPDAINETAAASAEDSGNDTTTAELPPEEIVAVMTEVSAAAGCSMTVLPAVEDVYVDIEEETAYNDDHLLCKYLKGYGYEEDEFLGIVMVQFNITDLELQEDDVAVLVLKAESMEKVGDEMASVILMPTTSEWSENSSVTTLELNMLSIIAMMSEGGDLDFSSFGISFGGDEIFAFDVSEQLKAAEGGRISFLLMAMGDTDYKVSFKSRETGEGPCLLIAPYPSMQPA